MRSCFGRRRSSQFSYKLSVTMKSYTPGIEGVKQLERFSCYEPSKDTLYFSAMTVWYYMLWHTQKAVCIEGLKTGCCSTELPDPHLWSNTRTPTCSFWAVSVEDIGDIFQLVSCWKAASTLNRECLVNIFSREMPMPAVGSAKYADTLLSLPSQPQVLQGGTSVHSGCISWKCALEHK